MKKRLLLGSGALLMGLAVYMFTLSPNPTEPQGLEAIASIEAPKIKRSVSNLKGEEVARRLEYEFMRLRNPETGEIPSDMRKRELAFVENLPSKPSFAAKNGAETWSYRGPNNVGGRTRALAIDINYDGSSNQRILAGGVSGGMYKSEDSGQSWTLTSDQSKLASVTAVAQDPNNPSTWYYGTGEFSGNSASGPGASYLGHGMFKSTDNGNTWTQIESTISGEFTGFNPNTPNDPLDTDDLFDFVWDIEIHPTTGVIYVGGWGVILTSNDGGDTWVNSLETFGNTADITIAADGSVYAALCKCGTPTNANNFNGIFKQNGATWTDISPPGLSADPWRIVLDAAPSDANTLYAVVQSNAAGDATSDHQFFRYNAGSDTWTDLSSSLPDVTDLGPNGEEPAGGAADFNSQGGYNLIVKTSPQNPEAVWIGATNLYRSTDGGQSFSRVGGYAGPYSFALYPVHHPDQHSMAFFPNDPNALISGHDGGLSMTMNAFETNQSWTTLNNGYVTSQFYTVAIDQAPLGNSQNNIIGGLQDNGTYSTDVMNPDFDWFELFSGDGSFAAIAPGAQTIYVSAQVGQAFRFTSGGFANVQPAGGSDFLFITPFVLDPGDENVMYMAAGGTVWRNSNLASIPNGTTEPTNIGWSALSTASNNGNTVTALAVPKQENAAADRMYFGEFGSAPSTSIIRVDNPAGNGAGTDITPTGTVQGSWPSSIVVNESNENEIIVTYSNYGIPSVFHTLDGGSTWSNIEGNLAGNDGPSVRWAGIVPIVGSPNKYFLATSTGVYSTSELAGAVTSWELEAPETIGNVVVNMLATRAVDGLVVAATHGRGMYSANVSGTTTSSEDEAELPTQAQLNQNYPNPFNPETTISFELAVGQQVELSVYDAMGRRVNVLESGYKAAGTHEVTWNATDQAGRQVASGMYMYRLHVLSNEGSVEQSLVGQMVLMK